MTTTPLVTLPPGLLTGNFEWGSLLNMSNLDSLNKVTETATSSESLSPSTSSTLTNSDQRFKTSIYFKFADGHTRNRTFPGDVSKRGRALLQEWSRQFRIGETVGSRPSDQRRVRTVSIRKNLMILSRTDAWTWLRASHQKYAALYHQKVHGRVAPIMDAYQRAPNVLSLSTSLYTNMNMQMQTRNLKKGNKASSSSSSVHSRGHQFIEIVWSPSVQFTSEDPCCMYLLFQSENETIENTTCAVVNTIHGSNGAYFDASCLNVGKYTLLQNADDHSSDTVQFEVKQYQQKNDTTYNTTTASSSSSSSSSFYSSSTSSSTSSSSSSSSTKTLNVSTAATAATTSSTAPTLPTPEPTPEPAPEPEPTPEQYEHIPIDPAVIESEHEYASEYLSTQYRTKTMILHESGTGARLANEEEVVLLKKLKYLLGSLLTTGEHSKFREVVGDFNLLRYLRGKKHYLHEAAACFRRHISIREEYGWNDTRKQLEIDGFTNPDYMWKYNSTIHAAHGTSVNSVWKTNLSAGMDANGDSVAIYKLPNRKNWMAELINVIDYGAGWMKNGHAWFRSGFINRQIQLDLLSRQQGRLTRTTMVYDAAGGTFWRCIDPRYKDFQVIHNRIIETCPELVAKIYVPGMTWFAKMVYDYLKFMVDETLRSKLIGFGVNSHHEMLSILGPSIFQKFLDLRNLDISSTETTSMVERDTVPQSITQIVTVRRGNITLKAGVLHEIAVEVDPSNLSAVSWKFTSDRPINFEMSIFKVERDHKVHEFAVVPAAELSTGDGIIELKEKGCLMLRWCASKNAGSYFWNCGTTFTQLNYELETVPKKQESVTASAIGLMMLNTA